MYRYATDHIPHINIDPFLFNDSTKSGPKTRQASPSTDPLVHLYLLPCPPLITPSRALPPSHHFHLHPNQKSTPLPLFSVTQCAQHAIAPIAPLLWPPSSQNRRIQARTLTRNRHPRSKPARGQEVLFSVVVGGRGRKVLLPDAFAMIEFGVQIGVDGGEVFGGVNMVGVGLGVRDEVVGWVCPILAKNTELRPEDSRLQLAMDFRHCGADDDEGASRCHCDRSRWSMGSL